MFKNYTENTSLQKQVSKTVHNAIITLADTDDSGKGRTFKSRFIQAGIAGYPNQFGNVLITKESLDKFIKTMVGVPVIINHKDLSTDNVDDERVGVVSNVWYDDKDGWYWCDGIIWDETAINLIKDKGWSVSCSYNVLKADDEGGTENNIKYDMEFLDGVFTHLAIVNNPRYERANIVVNSKTEIINYNPEQKRDEFGKWVKDEQAIQKKKDSLKPIEVKADELPQFETKEDFVNWAVDIFRDLGSVNILDTDTEVFLSGRNAKREASKRRAMRDSNKAVFHKFKEMVEKSIKVDERPADEGHIHDQDLYFNKIKVGETPFNIEFAFDYHKNRDEYRYAGHKVVNSIKMTPSDLTANASHAIGAIHIINDDTENFNPKNDEMLSIDNDKWITIKPHGEDSKDYRRIKLEDDETPKEAIDRVYKKEDDSKKSSAEIDKERKGLLDDLIKKYKTPDNIPEEEKQAYLAKDKKLAEARQKAWTKEENKRIADKKAKSDENAKVQRDSKKFDNYYNQIQTKLKELKTDEARKSYIDYIQKEVEKYPEDVNYADAVEFTLKGEKQREYMRSQLGKDKTPRDITSTTYERAKRNKERDFDNYFFGNKAKNSKESDMALLDEIKKLISRVENEKDEEKGEEMDKDEKKIENEKVDKRKLIDEVGGILKDKVNDEVIRTIIGKLEKVAYDKSEDGTADNKKAVKNEEDDKEKDKEEKVKEIKEEIHKDVDNKCKNSVDNSKDDGQAFFEKVMNVYNSAMVATEKQSAYVSRQEKLDRADAYFS